MPAGIATTVNTPNYLGMLFNANRRRSAFLSLIGGIDGAGSVITENIQFPVSVAYTIDNPSTPEITEDDSVKPGTPTYIGLEQAKNVVQIFQEDVTVSRLRSMNRGALQGINTAGAEPEEKDELARQVVLHLEKMKRDMNYTAINGTYQDAGITSAAGKLTTRGIVEAITSNVVEGALDVANIAKMIRLAFDKGTFDTPVIFANSENRQAISALYQVASLTEVDADRFTAGVAVNKIVTEFGDVYLATDNDVPADVIFLADIAYVKPVFMRDVDTGEVITVKPLSQRGGTALEIYGTFGLDHNNELQHSKLVINAELGA